MVGYLQDWKEEKDRKKHNQNVEDYESGVLEEGGRDYIQEAITENRLLVILEKVYDL